MVLQEKVLEGGLEEVTVVAEEEQMKVMCENDRTWIRERGGQVVGQVIDGLVIEGLNEDITIDNLITILNEIEYMDDEDNSMKIEVDDKQIEVRDDKRGTVKATIDLDNNMAWAAIETLRRNKVKVAPYILGDKLLKRRA